MNRYSVTVGVVLFATGACLPERFRSATDASDDGAARSDVLSMPDREASEGALDVTVVDDVASMDVVSADDARADSMPDALPDARPDSAPVVTAPLGSDLRRLGLFQARFSGLPGTAPTGANCQSAGMPSEALWLSVEVPAMSQRRLIAEASNVDSAILPVVSACGGDCSSVSAPSSLPMSGTTFVILDNRTNPMPRTFHVAASARNASSRFGNATMNFVVQRVDEPARHSILLGMPGTLSVPTLNSTTPSARRLTLDWSLGTCATGAYVEVCRDPTCSSSYCGGTLPCSYHVPARSPRFDINFRESGAYFVRMRSLRFWIPANRGEPMYGSEVLTMATTQMVVIS